MRLQHRLARLEKAAGVVRGKRCPDCGHRPGAPMRVRIRPAPVVHSMAELLAPPDESGDVCRTCGHRWVFRLRVPEIVGIRGAS